MTPHHLTTPWEHSEQTGSDFGRIAKYGCGRCNKWIYEEPQIAMFFRGSAFQPPDGAYICPHCGFSDGDVSEAVNHHPVFKVARRYRWVRLGMTA